MHAELGMTISERRRHLSERLLMLVIPSLQYHPFILVVVSPDQPRNSSVPNLPSSTALNTTARLSPGVIPFSTRSPTWRVSILCADIAEYISRHSLPISPFYTYFGLLSTTSYPCHIGSCQILTSLSCLSQRPESGSVAPISF